MKQMLVEMKSVKLKSVKNSPMIPKKTDVHDEDYFKRALALKFKADGLSVDAEDNVIEDDGVEDVCNDNLWA
jgi:hypothetical protein